MKLEVDAETKLLRVATPILKGPGYKAGLRAGDLITHIRVQRKPGKDDTWETFSTQGMSVERADALLLGPEGTPAVIVAIPARRR